MFALNAAIVALFAVALRSGKIPLGVPGEWEWQRLKALPDVLALGLGSVGVGLFAGFAAIGYRALSRSNGPSREGRWLFGLVVASILVQGVVQEAAPTGYGLSKWILALHAPGSSGYYTVARRQMANPRQFVADYPRWIARQDALHVGTHPPGLFVVARGLLDLMEAKPGLARWVEALAPPSVTSAIQALKETEGLPRPDAAALTLTGALTLLACSMTVVPIYLLARSSLSSPASWVAAVLWPLVPSSLLFQPTADTAFPILSTTALALACWAGRSDRLGRRLSLNWLAGLVLAIGMVFTLAFLPVGLVVALVLLGLPGRSWLERCKMILATGLGFLMGTLTWWALTSANPFAIWWINQRNHGRFYAEYTRSYLGWILVNPVELAIALGLPATVWALVGLGSGAARPIPRVTWATLAVLVLLTISGKNLSEVARLWLPLMPPILVAAGSGFARVAPSAGLLAGSLGLMGAQVLILEATIQVVYPITL